MLIFIPMKLAFSGPRHLIVGWCIYHNEYILYLLNTHMLALSLVAC